MGVQLNIKDPDTVRLARELAEATGQPITQAIRQALESELRRREEEVDATVTRLRDIAHEFRDGIPEEWRDKTSREWMDDIYDEDGLPR
jgi:antitoxin VapB